MTYVLLHSHDIVSHSHTCSLSHFREEKKGSLIFVGALVSAGLWNSIPSLMIRDEITFEGRLTHHYRTRNPHHY